MVGMLKFLAKNLVTVLLIVLVAAATVYATGKFSELRHFLFPDEVIAENKYTIVTGVQGLGYLVTAKHEVAKTDITVEIHRGFLNSGYYSANHSAIGAIEAGIDFGAIDENSIRHADDTYSLTLPAPIVTSCRIEYIDQNQHSFTLLSADWDMVRQIAQAEALEQFAQEMIEAGLLERAAEEAELRVGEFVRNLTGSPAVVQFEDADGDLDLPDSCKPIPPSGWEKAAEGGWRRSG